MKGYISILMLLALSGCSSISLVPSNQEPTHPPALTKEESCEGFASIQPGQSIFVTFDRSPTLTQKLRDQLEARQVRLAETPEQADLHYTVAGNYDAIRPGTGRLSKFAVGDWVENPKSIKTWKPAKGEISLSHISNPFLFVVDNIVTNISNASGASEKVAQWSAGETGDPDGRCVKTLNSTCEQWLYTQVLTLDIRKEKIDQPLCQLSLAMKEDKIRPLRLLDPGIEWLSMRLTHNSGE